MGRNKFERGFLRINDENLSEFYDKIWLPEGVSRTYSGGIRFRSRFEHESVREYRRHRCYALHIVQNSSRELRSWLAARKLPVPKTISIMQRSAKANRNRYLKWREGR